MFRLITILIISFSAMFALVNAQAETTTGQKAVLITGASTGLGRVMAETMAAQGYFVYAGARKDKDLQELNAIENIQAVKLDVNKQQLPR